MTLQEAQAGSVPGDIIFAHASSVFNGESIVLQDDQRFLGEGVVHLFVSNQGTFVLPGMIGAPRPQIFAAPDSAAITMANNNEIRNFFVKGADGFPGSANASNEAIFADGVTGGLIRDVTVVGGDGAGGTFNSIAGNGGAGIFINNSFVALCNSQVTGGNGGAGVSATAGAATGGAGGMLRSERLAQVMPRAATRSPVTVVRAPMPWWSPRLHSSRQTLL